MDRKYKTAGITAQLLMLAGLYLPLSAEGSFRTLFYGGSGAVRAILLLLAVSSLLSIVFRVHGSRERSGMLVVLLNLVSIVSMLILAFGIHTVQIGRVGTIVYLSFAVVCLVLSYAEKEASAKTDYEDAVPQDSREKENYQTDYDKPDLQNEKKTASKSGTLKIMCGDLKGSEISVKNMEPIKIGSDPERCNIVMEGRGISRVHCMITYNAVSGTFLVMDESTNGTYIIRNDIRRRLPENYAIELRKGTLVYLVEEKNAFLLEA